MELGFTNLELVVNSFIKVCTSDGWKMCKVIGQKEADYITDGKIIIPVISKPNDALCESEFVKKHHGYYIRYNMKPKVLIPSPIKDVWIICDTCGFEDSAANGVLTDGLFYIDHPKSKKIFPLLFRGGHTAIVHTIAKNEGLTDYKPNESVNLWTIPQVLQVMLKRRKHIFQSFPCDTDEVVFTVRNPIDRWLSTINIFTNIPWHSFVPWLLSAANITDKHDIWRMVAWLPLFYAVTPSSIDSHFVPLWFLYEIFMNEIKRKLNKDVKVSFVKSSDLSDYWNNVLGEPFYISHKHKRDLLFNKKDIPLDVMKYLLNETLKKDIDFINKVKLS